MLNRATKETMHPRNRFREGYDFRALVQESPTLAPFVGENAHGDASVDYANPAAVKALNQALLRQAYGLQHWDIPRGYLCPPIPGRSDYVHHLADLVSTQTRARGAIKVLDIGVGASCIYPLIGANEYGWRFVGSEVDPIALRSANKIASSNAAVADLIECRAQPSTAHYFKHVIRDGESFDLSMCNPPFHASAAEAAAGSERKRRNLGGMSRTTALNFGGQPSELWCRGGELGFIVRMIDESAHWAGRVRWFTTLVSKSEHLARLRRALTEASASEVHTIDMAQGQKKSRILAWAF